MKSLTLSHLIICGLRICHTIAGNCDVLAVVTVMSRRVLAFIDMRNVIATIQLIKKDRSCPGMDCCVDSSCVARCEIQQYEYIMIFSKDNIITIRYAARSL